MPSNYLNYLGVAMPVSSSKTKTYWGNGVSSRLGGGGVDDTFYVWSQADVIVESAGAMATDIADINGAYQYLLPANVVNLTISGTVSTAIGNSLSNLIVAQGATNMTIDGDGGNDVIVANSGADTIVMQPGYGHEVVYSFNVATDVLRLANFGITSFSGVRADMSQVGSDVVLTLDANDSVILRNTTIGSLTAANFELSLDRSSFKLTFDDEFNQFVSSPDGSHGWMTTFPYSGAAARTLAGNDEAEYYSDSSVGVDPFSDSNGVLTITATPATPGVQTPAGSGLTYTSGLITTYKSFSQLYGYFEVRAELPAGSGFWPAFWLLPANNSWPPELDVFEMLGADPDTLFETAHSDVGGFNTMTHFNTYLASASSGFHTYGVDWEKSRITWYVDNVAVASMATPADMNVPMYMLLNLGVGRSGSVAGAPTGASAQMLIDYVKAYAAGSAVTTVSAATFLAQRAALDGTPFAIADTGADILANIGAIASDAANISSVTATDGEIGASAATYLADRAALDLVNGGFEIIDSATHLAAALGALSDPGITKIVDSSNNSLSVSVAQLTSDSSILAKLANANGAPIGLVVTDSAANIEAGLGALSADSAIASISVVGGPAAISAATYAAHSGILDKISGGFDISDSAGDLTGKLGKLADNDINVIVDTSNHPIGVSVAVIADDAPTLQKLVDQNGSPYQLAVTDTASAISGALALLASDGHVASIHATGGVPTFSVAALLADAGVMNEIDGGFVIADTDADLIAGLATLQADSAHISAVDPIGGVPPTVSVSQFSRFRGILDKIAGGFAILDKASTIAASAGALQADAAHITSITATSGSVTVSPSTFLAGRAVLDKISSGFTVSSNAANVVRNLATLSSDSAHIADITASSGLVTVSAATFLADRAVLDKISGGFAVSDSAANITRSLATLSADADHLTSIRLSGAPGQTLTLTRAQASADAPALAKIASTFKLKVIGASAGNTGAHLAEASTGAANSAASSADFGRTGMAGVPASIGSEARDLIAPPTAAISNFAAVLPDSTRVASAMLATAPSGGGLVSDHTTMTTSGFSAANSGIPG